MDEAASGKQPSSNQTDGGFLICEVDEQQAARVEVQGPERRAVICSESEEETQDYVRETLAISQEDADEIGFVPSALANREEPIIGVTIDGVIKP